MNPRPLGLDVLVTGTNDASFHQGQVTLRPIPYCEEICRCLVVLKSAYETERLSSGALIVRDKSYVNS